MRYPGSEKLEIIRLVEQSHLPVRRTLATLGILPMTFYRWYARLQAGGPEALEDKPSRPRLVWNKIPQQIRDQIVDLALDESELSPREVATRFTDVKKYFVSEASVYRLLKAHDLIASAAIKGIPNAQHNLAVCYTRPESPLHNPELAVVWFQTAAAHGLKLSMVSLSRIYEAGEGVERDPAKASYWRERAEATTDPLLHRY